MSDSTMLTAILMSVASLALLHGSTASIPRGRRVLKEGAAPKLCNAFFPCPSGYTCMLNPSAPGTKACFTQVQNAGQSRPGKCPVIGGAAKTRAKRHGHGHGGMFGRNEPCMWHVDCASGKRCCPSTDARGGTVCTPSLPINGTEPIVTVIQPGLQATNGPNQTSNTPPTNETGSENSGTITLVQSKGKNVLFDTGAPAAKVDLLNGLASQGLTLEDIDHVEISHGHPDHYGNIGFFGDLAGGVGQFDLNWYGKKSVFRFPKKSGGNVYGWTTANGQQQYFIFDDANMQMVKANGHTTQDATLVVRNAQGMGTVFIVGDVFMYEADYTILVGNQTLSDYAAEDPEQNPISRKWIACNADWVIPGHGTAFQPDDKMKAYFKC